MISIEPQLQVKVNYLPKPLVGGSERCRLAAHAASDEDARQAHHGCPERSLVQRMEALQRANEIRTKRATLKRDLKAGKVSIP